MLKKTQNKCLRAIFLVNIIFFFYPEKLRADWFLEVFDSDVQGIQVLSARLHPLNPDPNFENLRGKNIQQKRLAMNSYRADWVDVDDTKYPPYSTWRFLGERDSGSRSWVFKLPDVKDDLAFIFKREDGEMFDGTGMLVSVPTNFSGPFNNKTPRQELKFQPKTLFGGFKVAYYGSSV